MLKLAIVLLLQSPAKEPPTAKQAYEVARIRAARWDANAACSHFSIRPKDDTVYLTGKAPAWDFLFFTKKNAEPGKVRAATLQVFLPSPADLPKEMINGYGVTLSESSGMEAPLPVPIDMEWLDSDKAFAGFKKAGLCDTALGITLLELRTIHGKTVWHGRTTKDEMWLDPAARLLARGEPVEAVFLQRFARPAPISDAVARVTKDWSSWKGAGPVKIVAMDALAIDSVSLSQFKAHRAWFDVVVSKPDRHYRVRVIEDRVEWQPGVEAKEGDFTAAVAFPFEKLAGMREGLVGNESVRAFLAKTPKAHAKAQTVSGKLLVTFEPGLILKYDPATGTFE